ncbi:SAM-dependent methyltransferase [Hypericibacter terrae]|uniref:SAM-dependent methyltransferase n=1 Tax=Hypericibacter terrae TaxID=2602015 RepID=A0A5J6MTK4_9PROT|nr:class I SAM-dependent methyltransferase [Hypericibacter terrae]QEX20065.1 SAM-dependent methyltransferase [Hypericibacter terrae]
MPEPSEVRMAQNIYDDEIFFAGYSQLPRSIEGLEGAPEWPSLRALLPPLAGRRVLDLGCGFGWFCRWASHQGAASVTGIDLSSRMLARAKAETQDPMIAYVNADLEQFDAEAATFDLVYSSLAFHYLRDLTRLLTNVHEALRPGGKLVFSVEHPIYTAPREPGWLTNVAGRGQWPVDGYLDEGARSTDWLVKGVIKQHRMIGTYVDLLRRAGFVIAHIEERGPSREQAASHPEWAPERERPMFLLLACDRA